MPKILEVFPEFNRKSYREIDFWDVCYSKEFETVERRQKRKGYYVADYSGDYIFIDSRLKNYRWLAVAFHELSHALLHFPSPFLAEKQQFEANAFSIMMLCPLPELDAGSEMRKAAKYDHVVRFLIRERERLYFLYDDFGIRQSVFL